MDKKAKFMRYKSWPLWEDWKLIFGKDRATGGTAEDLEVAADEVRDRMAGGSADHDNDYHPSFEDFLPNDVPHIVPETPNQNNISGNTEQQASSTKSGSQKRKLHPADAALMEFLGNLHADTNSQLDAISQRIGYEFDVAKARETIYTKLGSVEGLTLAHKYKLCNILGDKPQRLEVLNGIPECDKLGYVLMLIEDNS